MAMPNNRELNSGVLAFELHDEQCAIYGPRILSSRSFFYLH